MNQNGLDGSAIVAAADADTLIFPLKNCPIDGAPIRPSKIDAGTSQY